MRIDQHMRVLEEQPKVLGLIGVSASPQYTPHREGGDLFCVRERSVQQDVWPPRCDDCSEVGVSGVCVGALGPWGCGSCKLGEESVFGRGGFVPVAHPGFLKPPTTAIATELKNRDLQPGKELEYVKAALIWLDVGRQRMKCWHAGTVFLGCYHTRNGSSAAKIYFHVEQSHDAVQSTSHRAVRETLG